MIHLDTHVALWLHTERIDRLPARARRLVEEEAIAVSPMLELELALLHEIGRLAATPEEVVGQLAEVLGVGRSGAPFSSAVREAARLTWTRDPYDRLICGTALADGASLLTADRLIRANLPSAAWD